MLGVILLCGSWLRITGITQMGVSFVDAFGYIYIAEKWAHGDYTVYDILGRPFFRPALFLTHALALSALGFNDYSIKIVNVAMDIAGIAMVGLLSLKLYGFYSVALSAAALYAFSRTAVLFSTNELAHCPSTFFLLLSFLFFVSSIKKLRRPDIRCQSSAFMAGVALSLSSLTHGDIALLIPLFILLYLIFYLDRRGIVAPAAFGPTACFWVGVGIPFTLFLVMVGMHPTISSVTIEIGRTASRMEKSLLPFSIRLLNGTITTLYSKPTLWLFWAASLETLLSLVWRRRHSLLPAIPLFSILGYVIFFDFLIVRGDPHPRLYRLLSPLLPCAYIVISVSTHRFAARISRAFASILLVCVTFWMISSNFQRSGPVSLNTIMELGVSRTPSVYRQVFDILRERIKKDSRLLIIAPYSNDIRRIRGYQSPVYFSSNAIYLADCPGQWNMEDYLLRNEIEYVLVDIALSPKDIKSEFRFPGCFLPLAGPQSSTYDKVKAVDYLLSAHRAEVLTSVHNLGTIYRLNRDARKDLD